MPSLFDPSELYQALQARGLLPDWAKQLPYTPDTVGEFLPETNKLIAREPGKDQPLVRNTLSHEMTHAVQHNLLKATARDIQERKWNKQPVTEQEEQYLKAAQTLFNEQYGRVGQFDRREYDKNKESLSNVLKALYKNKSDSKAYQEYMEAVPELQARGVGNMTQGGYVHPEDARKNLHLDASFATDFSVLKAMYDQLPQSVKASSAATKKSDIEANRRIKAPADYRFEDPFYADPFQAK